MQVKSYVEHSAILSTFIKLTFVNKIVSFLSVFEWLVQTGFTVIENYPILAVSSCRHMLICIHVGTPLVYTVRHFKTNKMMLNISSLF